MLAIMQTTITIDEEILQKLEARAASEGTTVSQVIEDSLREAARSHSAPSAVQPFELVTFGKGGRFTKFNVDRVSTLIEEDDRAGDRTRLRVGNDRR
jgi:hypothetical protein